MKRILFAIMAVGAMALSGCSATCQDACDSMSECVNKLGLDATTTNGCVTSCENDNSCGDAKQDMIDCMADIKCADATSAATEMAACSAKCSNK
jgi:hypothetical protein